MDSKRKKASADQLRSLAKDPCRVHAIMWEAKNILKLQCVPSDAKKAELKAKRKKKAGKKSSK